MKVQELRNQCLNQNLLPDSVLQWITRENLWNLWVPKKYGGLESSFSEGLQTLKELVKTDGSLGWTVTLCSGANYFVGNLQPKTAQHIFKSGKPVIIGGSGSALGTAEYKSDTFILNGKWKYATGAPYLSHYTCNATVTENGKPIIDSSGKPKVLSFILSKEKVKPIDDWDMMGLQATATRSFTVENIAIRAENTFLYNQCYLPHPIFKIPFRVFANLTLWVNYQGMAEHYMEEAERNVDASKIHSLKALLKEGNKRLTDYSHLIEQKIDNEQRITPEFENEIHAYFSMLLPKLNTGIIEIHPNLGMKAARNHEVINAIFRDYFTATQHYNFVGR